MSDKTTNLKIPYIVAAQAQKHVTHNEALRALDAIVQLHVQTRTLSAPPSLLVDGARYIVGAAATESWSGHENQIAAFQDNSWLFYVPQQGWLCWVHDEEALIVWKGEGEGWSTVAGDSDHMVNPVPFLGVNTVASHPDKLAVKSDAVLLSHDDVTPGSGDIQIKVNKAGQTDTASFLFQDGYSGRAEIGLTGDDDFHFKVSPDGSSWYESIKIDKNDGAVTFPSGLGAPPQPTNLTSFDRLYLDPVNGNDANDGTSVATAIKTAAGVAARYTIGRKLQIKLLGDIVWDHLLTVGYVVPQLEIFGRNATDTAYENRTITVVDAINNGAHPGGFLFYSFASVYVFKVSIDLNTARGHAFFNFYNSTGYLRTHSMTLRRLGTGATVLFANGASFVPSQHSAFNLDVSAQGYVARGIAANANPNNDWRYPSNETSF